MQIDPDIPRTAQIFPVALLFVQTTLENFDFLNALTDLFFCHRGGLMWLVSTFAPVFASRRLRLRGGFPAPSRWIDKKMPLALSWARRRRVEVP